MGTKEKLAKKLGREPTAAEVLQAKAEKAAKKAAEATASGAAAAAPVATPVAVAAPTGAAESKEERKARKKAEKDAAAAAAAAAAPAAPAAAAPPSTGGKRGATPYNLFMKAELARVKAANATIDHKTAFKLAASHWALSAENPKNNGVAQPVDKRADAATIAAAAQASSAGTKRKRADAAAGTGAAGSAARMAETYRTLGAAYIDVFSSGLLALPASEVKPQAVAKVVAKMRETLTSTSDEAAELPEAFTVRRLVARPDTTPWPIHPHTPIAHALLPADARAGGLHGGGPQARQAQAGQARAQGEDAEGRQAPRAQGEAGRAARRVRGPRGGRLGHL